MCEGQATPGQLKRNLLARSLAEHSVGMPKGPSESGSRSADTHVPIVAVVTRIGNIAMKVMLLLLLLLLLLSVTDADFVSTINWDI